MLRPSIRPPAQVSRRCLSLAGSRRTLKGTLVTRDSYWFAGAREKRIKSEDLDIAADDVHRAELMRRLPRVKAIPQIFIDGEHVGGYEDLEVLYRDGCLDQVVNAAES